jgi:hypothetical protein
MGRSEPVDEQDWLAAILIGRPLIDKGETDAAIRYFEHAPPFAFPVARATVER